MTRNSLWGPGEPDDQVVYSQTGSQHQPQELVGTQSGNTVWGHRDLVPSDTCGPSLRGQLTGRLMSQHQNFLERATQVGSDSTET